MRRVALLASLTLAWPLLLQVVADPVLHGAESVGAFLGRATASRPAEATVVLPLPAPSPEEMVQPLGDDELRQLDHQDVNDGASDDGKPGPQGSKAPARKSKSSVSVGRGTALSDLPVAKNGIRVNEANILRLARARAAPGSHFAPSTPKRPAGLMLTGASALGIGVRDGDVLTHVAGTPVSDRSQVVNLVLQARARRATQISARFFRNDEPWMLVVDLPYPKPHSPDARSTGDELGLSNREVGPAPATARALVEPMKRN